MQRGRRTGLWATTAGGRQRASPKQPARGKRGRGRGGSEHGPTVHGRDAVSPVRGVPLSCARQRWEKDEAAGVHRLQFPIRFELSFTLQLQWPPGPCAFCTAVAPSLVQYASCCLASSSHGAAPPCILCLPRVVAERDKMKRGRIPSSATSICRCASEASRA